jgi:cytosine/adenosine deaminase-related metal-dependent hydrolase
MSTLLVRHAREVVTLDAARRRIPDGGIFVRDQVIEAVGPSDQLPASADLVIEAPDRVILPGLINTHHHLYQTLTRALPPAEDVELFDWLVYLYPIWAKLDGAAIYQSALVGLAELLLAGCTTVSDHLYLFPNDSRLDDEIRAAQELGVRFHPCRGSMSLGRSRGGLPPDAVVQSEAAIRADLERVVAAFHDPSPYAMLRIVVAPCSPFSVTSASMRESAQWAREHGLTLHTHVAETLDEEAFCQRKFGMRPVAYMQSVDWVGPDVWYAHTVHLNAEEIRLMADSGVGVAHCPGSNMRLGSGIAPIRALRDAGVKVGLAVDGSASNDAGHLLLEARLAMLLQRVRLGARAMSAEEALEIATLGGARVLGRPELGALEPGKAADFVAFDLNRLEYAGAAVHDPLGALLFCAPTRCDLSVINGRIVVEHGEIVGFDLERAVRRQNEIARRLLQG